MPGRDSSAPGKKPFHATAQARDDVPRHRAAFLEARQHSAPKALGVVQEAGRNQARARDDARAPQGHRARGTTPLHRGRHLTLVGALGVLGVVAALRRAGVRAGAALLGVVQEGLGAHRRPGQVVVLDHLTVYQGAGGQQALAAVGARIRY